MNSRFTLGSPGIYRLSYTKAPPEGGGAFVIVQVSASHPRHQSWIYLVLKILKMLSNGSSSGSSAVSVSALVSVAALAAGTTGGMAAAAFFHDDPRGKSRDTEKYHDQSQDCNDSKSSPQYNHLLQTSTIKNSCTVILLSIPCILNSCQIQSLFLSLYRR